MSNTITVAALLAAFSATASAQSETATFEFSFNPFSPTGQIFDLSQFDTQNGTRVLESIGIDYTGRYSGALVLENTSDDTLLATDYIFEHINSGALGFGDFGADDEGGEDAADGEEPDNIFLNTVFFTIFDAEQDLAPFDGVSGIDGADQVTQQFDRAFERQMSIDVLENPALASMVTGDGTIDLVVGSLIENFFQLNFVPDWGPGSGIFGQPLYPTDEALWFRFENYLHRGAVELTYNYSIIPAPSVAGLMGLAGLGAFSRRRR